MTAPTISSITPNVGHPGGQELVEIRGAHFQLPPEDPLPGPDGLTPPLAPTVRVFFGAIEARKVMVTDVDRILVRTPLHDPGAVTVEVRNVEPSGAPILGESVSLVNGFTFQRPGLVKDPLIGRVVRFFIRELKRQVLPEVVLTQHTDWTDSPQEVLRKLATAKLPAVILAGPDVRKNTDYTSKETPTRDLGGGITRTYRTPRTVDLVFTLGAISDNTQEFLALLSALEDFPRRNPWLFMPVDLKQPNGEIVRLEFGFEPDGDMHADTEANGNNLRSCTGKVSIRALDLHGFPEGEMGIEESPLLEDAPEVATVRKGT